MITREKFLKGFGGYCNSYSRYLVVSTTVDEVIRVLNEIDPEMCVSSGSEENGSVEFEVFGCLPDMIYDLTEKLKTTGYADTDWDSTYTVCARNGKDMDDYTAKWTDDCPYIREDDDLWDAFVTIKDNQTGAIFKTGAGAVEKETKDYYENIVNNHKKEETKMYDIVLIEKPGEEGLTKAEAMDMFDSLNGEEAYPIEIYNRGSESSAMGFISREAAEKLEFDYESSGLDEFVGNILADMNLENELGIYEFKELQIYLSR